MSFLKNMRQALNPDLPENWYVLSDIKEVEEIKAGSYDKPTAIFKHSTSCGISNMAKFQLEMGWDINSEDLDFYYLDLLSYRNISNKIAEDLGVVHQSPQLILLKEGEVVYKTSHHGVHLSGLKNALANLP